MTNNYCGHTNHISVDLLTKSPFLNNIVISLKDDVSISEIHLPRKYPVKNVVESIIHATYNNENQVPIPLPPLRQLLEGRHGWIMLFLLLRSS